MKPISLSHFKGMNNVKTDEALHVRTEEGYVTEPRIVLNADVRDGRMIKRDGATHIVTLTSPHNLWSCKYGMFVAASQKLYRIDGTTATELGSIADPDAWVSFEEAEGKVYYSNPHGNGLYDPETETLGAWGISTPVQPVLASVSGSLTAGTYYVCFTARSGSDISGNGPIQSIVIDSDNSGISILNRPSGCLAWVTGPDGDVFYYAGETDTIAALTSTEPLPTLWCAPPPYMKNLTYAFGVMWGSVGNKLYYSTPLSVDLFRVSRDFYEYEDEITLIARTPTGLFVGRKDKTSFMAGTVPEQMVEIAAGAGAVEGTLTYCNNVEELGDILSPAEKVHMNVPIWVSQEGIVIGNQGGRLFNLTQKNITFAPGTQGASLYRMKDGAFQYLTNFKHGSEGSGIGMSDDATVTVIRNGKVI